jgi:hypothetical protein
MRPHRRRTEALAELLLAARRQAWVMAAGVVFGIAAALFHYATSPKMFEASATLLIEEQRTELEQETFRRPAHGAQRHQHAERDADPRLAPGGLRRRRDAGSDGKRGFPVPSDEPSVAYRWRAEGVPARADPGAGNRRHRRKRRGRRGNGPRRDAGGRTAQDQHRVSPCRAQLRGGDLVHLARSRPRRRS